MNRKYFWFVFSLIVFALHTSNDASNDSLVDVWKKIEQQKKQSYESQMDEEINRLTMYGVIGGFCTGHAYGSLIDMVFGLNKDSGYAPAIALFGAFAGFSTVQVVSIIFWMSKNDNNFKM